MDNQVVLVIQGDGEAWTTTLQIGEMDLLRARNLRPAPGIGQKIPLASVNGHAQVKHGMLTIAYERGGVEKSVTARFDYAVDTIDRAIRTAADERASNEAWDRIWDWANEAAQNTGTLTVEAGSPVKAKLANFDGAHVAVEIAPGLLKILTVTNEDAMPAIGSQVVLQIDEERNIVILPA